MARLKENTAATIFQKDPNLPDFMDFNLLREEGLKHIGDLAGKIWTDHNVHDPGITILEVLIYALMDLGYKTNLPFEDLISLAEESSKDNNFLTPLEILTVNPVTITDYRKLILEIKGVRNAWLEPVESDSKIYIDQRSNKLLCHRPDPIEPIREETYYPELGLVTTERYDECHLRENYVGLRLNGLYKVLIEKDADLIKNDVQEKKLVEEVRKLLNAHRNLCEDFVDICILKPLTFDVCVEVEILPGFIAEKIYAQIYAGIKNFIQPELTYYTLDQLLDKEKPIEAIFAGRPYSEESFGFIDTEELDKLIRRKEIHLSDLYHIVLNIEGVQKIRKVHIKGGTIINKHSPVWVEGNGIPDDCIPAFSPDLLCIDLYSPDSYIQLDKAKIQKTFSFFKKFGLPSESLNCKVPSGVYREDLTDFYSVQNDFPVVYGIGPDGLSESETLKRKTQALQLKGYLMFFDQLLANYTSQLANIRALFSLDPEETRDPLEKRTYFTQLPDNIPGLEKLLKFYAQDKEKISGTLLALPVAENAKWEKVMKKLQGNSRTAITVGNYCDDKKGILDLFTFSSASVRQIYINQLIDSFYNKRYRIEILNDRHGCLFVIYPKLPEKIILVGAKRYKTPVEARNEAENTVSVLIHKESYQLVTEKSETTDPDAHYFGVHLNPISYIDLVQELTEDKPAYLERRRLFLDHLLARFGETFTNYTILQYQVKIGHHDKDEQIIIDQSRFISEYADISRNRAKSFNYLNDSWNTENVSGYEKRVSLLAGIDNFQRRNLCNFEVTPCFRLLLKDPKGAVLFRSNRSFETKSDLKVAATKVLRQLQNPEFYEHLGKRMNGFDSLKINRLFSDKASDENIVVTKYHHRQKLSNAEQEAIVTSRNEKIRSAKAARDKCDDFIANINRENKSALFKDKTLRLVPMGAEDQFLDTGALSTKIITLKSYKWHVQDPQRKKILSSDSAFSDPEEAWDHLVDTASLDDYLSEHESGLKWTLPIDNNIILKGLDAYPDAYRAVAAWRQAKTLGGAAKNYQLDTDEHQARILLKNEKKQTIATADILISDKEKAKGVIEKCIRLFNNRKTKPDYDKESARYGFKLPGKGTLPSLESYRVYDSPTRALQELGKVFKLGASKKNYLQSGDEGNPEYNFILKDTSDIFLAVPSEHFETASDRNKALNAVNRFVKKSATPVQIKEEPRRYIWTLYDNDKISLAAEKEFPSRAKAQADMDRALTRDAARSWDTFYKPHLYKFSTEAIPAEFIFIHGTSDSNNDIDPIFKSYKSFKQKDEAENAYSAFVKKLPVLRLRANKKKEIPYEFALYEKGAQQPLAVQYSKGKKKASVVQARSLISYINALYTPDRKPRPGYIAEEMVENQRGLFEWRFYKKNAPIAKSPYCCPDQSSAIRLKGQLCGLYPPIELKDCPPKKIVFRQTKTPKKYHYQVCFTDILGNAFVLNSFIGYDTHKEAKEAWKKEWIDLIEIARDPSNYGPNGKISLNEIYKDPNSKACDDADFLAVIPKSFKNELNKPNAGLIKYYSDLADLFPIYRVDDECDTECHSKYKYRVVTRKDEIDTDCEFPKDRPYEKRLLWESVDCFEKLEEVICEYQRFYNLAGTPNNCRVLCDKGCYYVGLVEVLVEGFCEFETEAEAWDDDFPNDKDRCKECIPGGVREFIYAAEDRDNFIPVCDGNYWKFKVVSPHYFVANHSCYYDSEKERDAYIKKWLTTLEELDWSKYITKQSFAKKRLNQEYLFLTHIAAIQSDQNILNNELCNWIHELRDCLKICEVTSSSSQSNKCEPDEKITKSRKDSVLECLRAKFKNNPRISALLKGFNPSMEALEHIAAYFPVYKTDDGYCFRLYWPENDKIVSEKGLQPCGCDDELTEDIKSCGEAYPFVSSKCFSCCEEALAAFVEFCKLITSGAYSVECTSKTDYGPYSFQIIDKSRELGYHPQQYKCLQEVLDAIELTKACVDNTGMHLLEHILLRPKDETICLDRSDEEKECCLLPICPDYCCSIEWQPDLEKDDPCADENPDKIYYVPGSDPYSFWATLVLPAWDRRFRSKPSRVAFEKFLYREVPALVGLHILWLSPRNMCKFEDAYRRWLLWKQDPGAKPCDSDELSPTCMLIECIKELESEDPCPTVSGAQGECDCDDSPAYDVDTCCLPPDTNGSLFWGYCPPEPIPGQESVPDLLTVAAHLESGAADVVAQTKIKPQKKKTATKKVAPKTKAAAQKVSKKDLLSQIRKRKPKYIDQIKSPALEHIHNTRSYERSLFFLSNIPTINAYVELVKYLSRYSLQKGKHRQDFMELIRNASWHLFDKLVLDNQYGLKKVEQESLASNLKLLKEKGLSLNSLASEWNYQEMGSLAHTKTRNQLLKLLK